MDGADPWQGQQLLEQEQWEKMENQTKTAYAAFVQAQKAFQPALKDKTNPAYRSKYADLGSCIEAVSPALHTNGFALMQRTKMAEAGVSVQTIFLHETGFELDGGTLFVPAVKNDPQGFGSAITYARRYSLLAACGIAPEDDDGNAAVAAAIKAAKGLIESAETVDAIKSALYAASNKYPQHAQDFREIATQRKGVLIAAQHYDQKVGA